MKLTTENTEGTERGKDGGPAFPSAGLVTPAGIAFEGMSLRDWFAGMALQGIITGSAHPIYSDDGINQGLVVESIQWAITDGPGSPGKGSNSICEIWAWVAYASADAMLAQRERKEDVE